MPLSVEIMRDGHVIALRTVGSERMGSISDNKPSGRQVYLFGCSADGTCSRLLRSTGGMDVETGDVRMVTPLKGLETVALMRKGEAPYELDVTTASKVRVRLRFTHL